MGKVIAGFVALAAAAGIALVAIVTLGEPPSDRNDSAAPSTPTTEALETTPTSAASPAEAETVEGFIIAFRVALDAGDVDFLTERLHPIVQEVYGIDVCRAFVEREIVLLENYAQIGEADGPTTRAFETPSGTVSVATFSVPIAFDFRGEHFEDAALYGLAGGRMHWFAECRS